MANYNATLRPRALYFSTSFPAGGAHAERQLPRSLGCLALVPAPTNVAREEKRRCEIKKALHQLQQLWGAAQPHERTSPDGQAAPDTLARGADCKGKGGAA